MDEKTERLYQAAKDRLKELSPDELRAFVKRKRRVKNPTLGDVVEALDAAGIDLEPHVQLVDRQEPPWYWELQRRLAKMPAERLPALLAAIEGGVNVPTSTPDAELRALNSRVRELFVEVYEKSGNNLSATARTFGIDRKSVERKLASWGLR